VRIDEELMEIWPNEVCDTTSVTHVCRKHDIIAKSIHHAMDVTSIETELFVIRCISQATQVQGIKKIIVIINAISAAKWIFDSSIHSFQLHSIAISNDLRGFFNKNIHNTISFWDCLSNDKWPPHLIVNKESKAHHIKPV